jgi:membrane protein
MIAGTLDFCNDLLSRAYEGFPIVTCITPATTVDNLLDYQNTAISARFQCFQHSRPIPLGNLSKPFARSRTASIFVTMKALMPEVTTAPGPATAAAKAPDRRKPDEIVITDVHRMWTILQRHAWKTGKYLTETEVHTYAFSVAANAILSFFPAIVLLLTMTTRVFHSQTMYDVVLQMLRDYLPSNQDFIIKNLRAMASHQKVQIFSLVMLAISSTGIFLPLEVALNKVWGIEKNRSYLMNQLIALVLAFACGSLAMLSIGLTAGNQNVAARFVGSQNFIFTGIAYGSMKACAMLASICIFFVIYWVLPNGKVPARAVLPAAMITGVLFEVLKNIYVFALPYLDFQEVYGPFYISVTLIFWAFLSGLLLLGGAYLSAAEHQQGLVDAIVEQD